jgi:hypothetical protein
MGRPALLAVLMLCGCSRATPLPPLAAGLPTDVRQAQAEFNRRVSRAFPIGTPERAVRSTLSGEGFDVGTSGAELARNHFPCSTKWIIRWRAAAAKVTTVEGVYGYVCP